MYFKSIAKVLLAAAVGATVAQADTSVPYERLSKNDTALLLVDLQVGLSAMVRDYNAVEFRQNVLSHAALGKMFNIPVVMATSVQDGPNGPLPKEILEMFPDAPLIQRPGQVNAWDDPDFRAAVRATNKTQLVLAGIATDVCVAFLALSLRQEGYHVVVNAEASGAFDHRIAQYAINRMQAAGVQVMNTFSIANELFRDWRSTDPSAEQLVPYFDQYQVAYSWPVRAHAAAVENGTLTAGENVTIAVNPETAAQCVDW